MSAVPYRSYEQQIAALQVANGRRTAAREAKAALQAMSVRESVQTAAAWLREPPEHVKPITVAQLLMSVNRMRVVKAEDVLKAAGIRIGRRRVRELTARERERVALALEAWVSHYRGTH